MLKDIIILCIPQCSYSHFNGWTKIENTDKHGVEVNKVCTGILLHTVGTPLRCTFYHNILHVCLPHFKFQISCNTGHIRVINGKP